MKVALQGAENQLGSLGYNMQRPFEIWAAIFLVGATQLYYSRKDWTIGLKAPELARFFYGALLFKTCQSRVHRSSSAGQQIKQSES